MPLVKIGLSDTVFAAHFLFAGSEHRTKGRINEKRPPLMPLLHNSQVSSSSQRVFPVGVTGRSQRTNCGRNNCIRFWVRSVSLAVDSIR